MRLRERRKRCGHATLDVRGTQPPPSASGRLMMAGWPYPADSVPAARKTERISRAGQAFSPSRSALWSIAVPTMTAPCGVVVVPLAARGAAWFDSGGAFSETRAPGNATRGPILPRTGSEAAVFGQRAERLRRRLANVSATRGILPLQSRRSLETSHGSSSRGAVQKWRWKRRCGKWMLIDPSS